MKITQEQAETLHYYLNLYWLSANVNPIDRDEIRKLISEIEEANRPKEIRYCVFHKQTISNYTNTLCPSEHCNIKIYVEKT